MAQRFSGKFSPDAQPHMASARDIPFRVPFGARLLFAAPVLLLMTSLNDGPEALVTAMIGAAIWASGIWMLQEGLKAEAAYHARKVARRPALPRKIIAGVLAGLGTGIATTMSGTPLVGAGLYAIAAGALHLAAFGIDPMRDKRIAGVDDFQQTRVARVVDQAEAHLQTMTAAIAKLDDRPLVIRVSQFQTAARRMIATVEEDPRDLSAARKYLGVYLQGASDATAKFAELYARNHDPAARSAYTGLLDDLEQNFADRTERMLQDDRSDLDVEINVLRARLSREGIKLPTKENE